MARPPFAPITNSASAKKTKPKLPRHISDPVFRTLAWLLLAPGLQSPESSAQSPAKRTAITFKISPPRKGIQQFLPQRTRRRANRQTGCRRLRPPDRQTHLIRRRPRPPMVSISRPEILSGQPPSSFLISFLIRIRPPSALTDSVFRLYLKFVAAVGKEIGVLNRLRRRPFQNQRSRVSVRRFFSHHAFAARPDPANGNFFCHVFKNQRVRRWFCLPAPRIEHGVDVSRLPGMHWTSHSSHETLALSSSGPVATSEASLSGTINTTSSV